MFNLSGLWGGLPTPFVNVTTAVATNCICVYTFAPLLSYFLGQYSMNSCVSHTLKQNDTGRAQRLVTVNILHYKKAQWPLTPKQTVAHTGTQSRILSVCVRAACARWWAKSRTRSLINGLAAELGAAGGEWQVSRRPDWGVYGVMTGRLRSEEKLQHRAPTAARSSRLVSARSTVEWNALMHMSVRTLKSNQHLKPALRVLFF